ncbi:8-oxoguanine glycosylase ogg1 [Tulasnella sp. 332]|nr:8-oxoguanine glycosylase ogg1 [Tulasnella sp. 332]
MSAGFRSIPLNIAQLSLPAVLKCGQSFRWQCIPLTTGSHLTTPTKLEMSLVETPAHEWRLALHDRVVCLRQTPSTLFYRAIFPTEGASRDEDALRDGTTLAWIRDYFQLDVDLVELYRQWSVSDEVFQRVQHRFGGIRILRQDPWENLISFICSQNNHISRITGMVQKLCIHYSPPLVTLPTTDKDTEAQQQTFHAFPPPQALASPSVDGVLRDLGFGYRAKYIQKTAALLCERHDDPMAWLLGLRKMSIEDARLALLELHGVGPKASVVPVDTHVYQIAVKHYGLRGSAGKVPMTPLLYAQLTKKFTSIWGEYAGWAHSVLFTSDLKSFSDHGIFPSALPSPSLSISSTVVASLPATPIKRKGTTVTTDDEPLITPTRLRKRKKIATPSAQAAAAQTCQYWSTRSLSWLWRDMKSFYPLLEILSSLAYKNSAWEFTSGLNDVDWGRFGRYAGYVHSLEYDQAQRFRDHRGLPSNRGKAYMFFHRPTSESSMFPNLTSVCWTVDNQEALMLLLPFLVPTIAILRINCRKPLGDACIKVLKFLAPRNILLTELRIALKTHTQTFLERLPDFLTSQRRLIRVGLPHYSASQRIVATLAALPFLEEYELWSFFEYQVPHGIGMDFDWEQGGFATLKYLALITSLADAAKVMSRSHQPRLDDFTLISRDFHKHAPLYNLCSSLSALQPSLTALCLSLYSDTVDQDPSSHAIPFSLIRPLLICTALRELCIRSDMTMPYNDEDIASMASAWRSLKKLSLCVDPTSDVGLTTGQPLRSVRSFTQNFRELRELGLYLSALDTNAIPGIPAGPYQSRLFVIDFGTSPVPTDAEGSPDLSGVAYVASLLTPDAKITSERSKAHVRFLQTSVTTREEYSRREKFWSNFATEVHVLLSGTTHQTQKLREPLH